MTRTPYSHAGYHCNKKFDELFLSIPYVAWLNATDPECLKLQPENCAWFLHDYLKPKGFIEDQMPLTTQDIVEMTKGENDDESSKPEDQNFASDESDPEQCSLFERFFN